MNDKLTQGFLGNQEWRQSRKEHKQLSEMSEFNPELAKFVIEYWSKKGSVVLDPFAGWGTRYLTAKMLGRNYVGFEISPATHADVMGLIQEHARQERWFVPDTGTTKQEYKLGDGTKVECIGTDSVDLLFTSPPYFDLEVYEDTPRQLSTLPSYDDFMHEMYKAAQRYYAVLKPEGYAVFVVGDWRINGKLRLFHHDLIDVMCQAGFYVHDFIVHKLNSPSIIGCAAYEPHGFVTKSHEYVLVFKKVLDGQASPYTQYQFS